MDESPSAERPLETTESSAQSALSGLRREVEPPRTAASLWLPLMALASATMLTIVSGVAVMTRAPRAVVVPPATEPATPRAPSSARIDEKSTAQLKEEVDRIIEQQRLLDERYQAWRREHIEAVHVPCHAPVYRADLDGRPQPFEECVEYRRKTTP